MITHVSRCIALAIIALGFAIGPAFAQAAVGTTAGELKQRNQWSRQHISGDQLPFSFVYDGKPSAELLAKWPQKTTSKEFDDGRKELTRVWTDPATGLEVRCISVAYSDYPVVEWTVYFRNTGTAKSPILEEIQGLDVSMNRPNAQSKTDNEYVLRGIRGDDNTAESYKPYEETLAAKRIINTAGRATNGVFPYWNLATPPGGGVIIALGWPGQWAATFARDEANSLHITAGQELTHLCLQPGEQVRSPLVALLFWKGSDPVQSQNLWRRWMLAHNLPRPGNKPLRPIFPFCSGGFFEGLKVSEASEKLFIDALTKEGIKLDYWWMDAGWYPCNAWPEVGTWEPDPRRFPNGIKAVSDYVHARGIKLIVWFEPERVVGGSWLAKNHPEWILGGALVNLGNPDARKWITDHIDKLIREQGIDLYRQDHNIDPVPFWRKNDTPDRQGTTENLYVQGYLAYWDELLRRHPGMLIDSCAGGGRRNDLETLRRAVPLLRSDYQAFDGNPVYALGNQGHTYGLSSWFPYYGQGVYYTSPKDFVYYARSHMSPSFAICVDVRKGNVDWNLYRRLAKQFREAADAFLGDYYPLTPYNLDETAWIAWQFDRPEQGDGMIQAFRRAKCEKPRMILRLHGLDTAAKYEVTDLDADQSRTHTGKELMDRGLLIDIDRQPGSALLKYRKL